MEYREIQRKFPAIAEKIDSLPQKEGMQNRYAAYIQAKNEIIPYLPLSAHDAAIKEIARRFEV